MAMHHLRAALLALPLFFAAPAQAAVTITFYSHALGGSFPHAFFTLRGTVDSTGAPVNINYGFTAVTVSPALLMGAVRGTVENPTASYVRASHAHFSVVMSDAEYGRLLTTVRRWQQMPQNSYNLDSANCVHFVADAARTLGMEAAVPRALRKRPEGFLNALQNQNAGWLAERQTQTRVAAR